MNTSGLTEFAEKHNIRDGYFCAHRRHRQGPIGWTEIGRAADGTNPQRRIELNEEAEIVSLRGSISRNARVSITAIIFVTETEGPSQPAQ